MSNSFSKVNHTSPLIPVKSPSMSQTSSPRSANTTNDGSNYRTAAYFGSGQKDDLAYFAYSPILTVAQ